MKRVWLALGLLCGACGGGSGSGTHVVGTGASAFTGVDAWSLVDNPGVCARVAANTVKADSTSVVIAAISSTALIKPGTYRMREPGSPSVEMSTTDASCIPSTHVLAMSGTVTLAEITSSEVSGSLDVTLTDGSQVRGSFKAPTCHVVGDASLPPACVQ